MLPSSKRRTTTNLSHCNVNTKTCNLGQAQEEEARMRVIPVKVLFIYHIRRNNHCHFFSAPEKLHARFR